MADTNTPQTPGAADEEELQRLMQLPLSQIDELPQEKQNMVYAEMARQIAEIPGFTETLAILSESVWQSQTFLSQEFFSKITAGWKQRQQEITAALEHISEQVKRMESAAKRVIEAAATPAATVAAAICKFIDPENGTDNPEALQIWGTLAPYIEAEADAHPEKYGSQATEPASARELIATAARKAREEGLDIPPLKAEEPAAQQIEMQIDLPTAPNKEGNQQSRSKRTTANETGALTTIGQRLLVPTDPEFQNAFASRVRADIGVFVIEKLTDLQLRDNGLQLSFLDNGISDLIDANKRTGARPLKDADTGFLRAMAKAAYRTRIYSDSMVTSFYLPAFCDELEIHGEHGTTASGSRAAAREKEILGRIEAMDNVWGKLPGKDRWWKVFSILGFDRDAEIVTVAMPYFNQLLAEIERKQQRQLEAGKKYYIGFCDLLHASAANERNQAAVELAARVLIGVQQRGGKPDAKLRQNRYKAIKDESVCTWSISCAGLIDECPQMQDKIEAQNTTGGRNKAMQRAFSTMYKVLREKSDLFIYYNDVTITEVIPTTKTLSAEIIIQHHGLNPDYQRPIIIVDGAQDADPAEPQTV